VTKNNLQRKYDIEFTTYNTLKGSKNRKSHSNTMLLDNTIFLHQVDWHRVVLDECQFIKNHESTRAVVVHGLSSYSRWIMSAILIQNKLGEMYSYFKFLDYPAMTDYNMFLEALKEAEDHGFKDSVLQRHWNACCLPRTKGTASFGAC
jgi:SNF2 family DNA or RNA helicase